MLLVSKGALIDIQHQHLRLVVWVTVRHHLDDVKNLEGGDHCHDAHKQDRRPDQRDGDPGEHLPGIGAVDHGSFFKLTGDALQELRLRSPCYSHNPARDKQ